MNILKRIGFISIEFIILLVLYVSGVTLSCAIRSDRIDINGLSYFEAIAEEGDYPIYYFQDEAVKLDNYTDRIMIEKSLISDKQALVAGQYMGGYYRYWHGYTIFLKSLLYIFNVFQLRKVLAISLGIVMILGLLLLYKRFGWAASLAFGATLIEYYTFNTAGSLQFFSCTLLMGAAVILLCLIEHKNNDTFLYLLFFALGSIINYVDLLTFPLITLTIPLLIVILYDQKEGKALGKSLANSILLSITWAAGYALTWISKWIIAGITLPGDIFGDVFSTALFRMGGSEEYQIDRVQVLISNINHPYILKHFTFLLIVLLIALVAVVLTRKEERKKLLTLIPVAVVMIYPYVWYEFMCGHSCIHHFFTYRAQMGTSFGLYFCILFCISKLIKVNKSRNK